jgi:Chaperone of endosialidase
MPHMLAQEHAGIYDCIRAGTARTQATIAAAIATIGATPTLLTLTFAGDGVWSIASNLTIPANVTLHIPPGVTVNRATGVTLTIQGVVIASGTAWETGPGTTVRTSSALTEVSGVLTRNLSVVTGNVAGEGLFVSGAQGAGGIKRVRLYTEQGNGGVGIQMSQLDNNNSWNWQMYANTGGGISWGLAAANIIMHLLPTGLGLGPNNTPSVSFYLQLNGDFAAKPGAGGLWTVPSSRVLKTLVGTDYTDGMARVRQLPPVRLYRYNGKAGIAASTDDEYGFVAEELQAVAPELVRPFEAKMDDDDEATTPLLATNLGPLLFTFVNALRELDARLQAIEGATPAPAEEPTPRTRRRTKE